MSAGSRMWTLRTTVIKNKKPKLHSHCWPGRWGAGRKLDLLSEHLQVDLPWPLYKAPWWWPRAVRCCSASCCHVSNPSSGCSLSIWHSLRISDALLKAVPCWQAATARSNSRQSYKAAWGSSTASRVISTGNFPRGGGCPVTLTLPQELLPWEELLGGVPALPAPELPGETQHQPLVAQPVPHLQLQPQPSLVPGDYSSLRAAPSAIPAALGCCPWHWHFREGMQQMESKQQGDGFSPGKSSLLQDAVLINNALTLNRK